MLQKVAAMQEKVLSNLTKQQEKYEQYSDKDIYTISTISAWQQMSSERSPLTLLKEYRKGLPRCNRLQSRTTGTFTVMDVNRHVNATNENDIRNTISRQSHTCIEKDSRDEEDKTWLCPLAQTKVR